MGKSLCVYFSSFFFSISFIEVNKSCGKRYAVAGIDISVNMLFDNGSNDQTHNKSFIHKCANKEHRMLYTEKLLIFKFEKFISFRATQSNYFIAVFPPQLMAILNMKINKNRCKANLMHLHCMHTGYRVLCVAIV